MSKLKQTRGTNVNKRKNQGVMESKEEIVNEAIQFYNKELNKYKFIAIPGIQKLITEERVPYLKQLNALNDIYIFQNYLLDNQKNIFNKPGNHTLTLFFSKVAGNLFSISQCLIVGQLVSASSIERDIFETYVDTKIVLEKDIDERSKLYEEYQHVLLWERMNTYKKYLNELKANPLEAESKKNAEVDYFDKLYKDIDENAIFENYEKVKHNYHPKHPYHWAWKIFRDETKDHRNPSLDFICKKFGIYEDYLHVYSTSSLAVHNQPFMANLMTREGSITSVPIFSETTNSIAGISASLVIEIIVFILRYGESDKLDEIKLFLNNLFKEAFVD
jgi:hypothetical protein